MNNALIGNSKWLTLLLASLLVATGCTDYVPSTYGQRGGIGATSLNGTRVLAEMFEEAGHRVRSWRYLSPKVKNFDVIVWFPDDFNAPSPEVEYWLTEWLTTDSEDGGQRVLIYVGRDYDAAPDYWQHMQGKAPQGLNAEYKRRLSEARADALAQRPRPLTRTETEDWFTLDAKNKQTKVKQLTGDWAQGIDSSKIDISRRNRVVPRDRHYEPLLSDEADNLIVSELAYDGGYLSGPMPVGRVIMVENGSWLLNSRLVNHEHRKLAGRLIDDIGPPRRNVLFLESGTNGPPIRDEDPSAGMPTGLELFRVWPIGAVLTQLAALGVVVSMMLWPIFGIPKRLERKSLSDFGSHVAAVGRMLANARNRAHAIGLLMLYRQSLRHESGGTEISQPSTPLPPPEPPASDSE
ncbi:DUF4350 domain-containing protein [Aeoliella sp.]|uniref:DUF4350 domain-containing protein n=1 Tax=Aeoliella sp. TaxID=2795800 RepID=UPI003CCBF36C